LKINRPGLTAALLLGGAAIVVGLIQLAWRLWLAHQIGFAADASGLPLPRFPRDRHVLDDGETCMLVHMHLAPAELDAVIRAAGFHPASHDDRSVRPQLPSDFRLFRQLPEKLRHGPSPTLLQHAGGCSSQRSWTALLDAEAGSLWIEVLYPDLAGDRPACVFPDLSQK
jgi:hypothetical protein